MPDDNKTDRVFAAPLAQVEAFKFDARVADVFENMITRSVPGYDLMLDMIGVLTEKFAQPGTNSYDLGCSLGASTLKIRQHLPASCHLFGVDASKAMIERARMNISRDHSQASVSLLEQSLQETGINNASVVVMNFTLQFIPDAERQSVLSNVANGMVKGGILILSEKIHFDDPDEQDQMTVLHHEFKKYQGYSDLEIAQKRASLENVLISNSEQQHLKRLSAAGFSSARLFLRCFNFVSFIAIKS